MKESRITFETAVLAKSMGFKVFTDAVYYDKDGKIWHGFSSNSEDYVDKYERPTQSFLQKWLRDLYGIHVNPVPYIESTIPTDTAVTGYYIGDILNNDGEEIGHVSEYNYPTYEDALEKGLSVGLSLIPTIHLTNSLEASIARSKIILGAPHNAKAGIKKLNCITHPNSDENTGLITKLLADKLQCSYVIESNAIIDPNKSLDTDYSKTIIKTNPAYLIEIHGHGSRGGDRPDNSTIEISSGAKEYNKQCVNFAKNLQDKMSHFESLEGFKVNGDFDKIFFKGDTAATILCENWISYHIELPISLRWNYELELPERTNDFIQCLASTINELCK